MDLWIKLEPKASPVEISDQRSARGSVSLRARSVTSAAGSRIPSRHHVWRPPHHLGVLSRPQGPKPDPADAPEASDRRH